MRFNKKLIIFLNFVFLFTFISKPSIANDLFSEKEVSQLVSNRSYPAGMDSEFAIMWEKAMDEVRKTKYPGAVPEIYVFSEPNYPNFHKNATVKGIKETLARYGAWNTSQKPYYLIFATTEKFADDKIIEVQSLLKSEIPIETFHGPTWKKMWNKNDQHFKMKLNWAIHNDFNGHTVQIFQGYSNQKTARWPANVLAMHEAWHSLSAMYAKPNYLPDPCWWTEGTAQFVAMSLAAKESTLNSYLKTGSMLTASKKRITSSKKIEGSSSKRTINGNKETCDGIGGNWEGTVVSATLISEYGWDKMLQFMKMPSNDINWFDHFKNVYGVTPEEFYKKSDKMLKMYSKFITR